MGLRLISGREEIERDMAALAIDCAAFIAERLASHLSESEARRLKAVITDLQINYAKNA